MTAWQPVEDVDPDMTDPFAADRRVLAEARGIAKRMDDTLERFEGVWPECPWCGGSETGPYDATLHNPDGCELADLLASLRKETP